MKSPIQCSTAVLNLIAFLAVLLVIGALAMWGKGDAAIMTGLIGVVGSFRPWQSQDQASGRPADPVNVKQADE
jgi:hypothetical protein